MMTRGGMRALGVDPGKKRVGVALSDPEGRVATPLVTLPGKDEKALVDNLARLAADHEAGVIVVGYPLNLDGSRGSAAKRADRLRNRLLEVTGLEVELIDERLTTAQATRAMREAGHRASQVRENVDKMAAVLILQTFLDRKRSR